MAGSAPDPASRPAALVVGLGGGPNAERRLRARARARQVAIETSAPAAGIAPIATGPWACTSPTASTAPETMIAVRNTEYRTTRNVSSVRAATTERRPVRRNAQSASAAPPAPAVGSRRVAAAPASVIWALSRIRIRGVTRPATSDSSSTYPISEIDSKARPAITQPGSIASRRRSVSANTCTCPAPSSTPTTAATTSAAGSASRRASSRGFSVGSAVDSGAVSSGASMSIVAVGVGNSYFY